MTMDDVTVLVNEIRQSLLAGQDYLVNRVVELETQLRFLRAENTKLQEKLDQEESCPSESEGSSGT